MGQSQSVNIHEVIQAVLTRPGPHDQILKQLFHATPPLSSSSIWSALNESVLERLQHTQPTTFARILYETTNQLVEIVAASKEQRAIVKPLTTVQNTYTINANTAQRVKGSDDPVTPATVTILSTCIRLLTRCMSVVMSEPRGAWSEYVWGGALPHPDVATLPPSDASLAHGLFGSSPLAEAMIGVLLDCCFLEGFTVSPSLAPASINKEGLRHSGVQLDSLWEVGFVDGRPIGGPPQMPNLNQWMHPSEGWSKWDGNRTEVLRCMIMLTIERVYMPPTSASPSQSSSDTPPSSPPNRYLQHLLSESSPCARWTPTLFWSVLNLILSYHPERTSMLHLPYEHALFNDLRGPLVETAMHLMLIALDYRKGGGGGGGEGSVNGHQRRMSTSSKGAAAMENNLSSPKQANDQQHMHGPSESKAEKAEREEKIPETAVASDEQQQTKLDDEQKKEQPDASGSTLADVSLSPSPPPPPPPAPAEPSAVTNVFHHIFTSLSHGACLSSIFRNICRLLHNALMAESTYLPGSIRKLDCFQELLVLMWKLADENAQFLPHVLREHTRKSEQVDIMHLIIPLLYFMHSARHDPSQLGLLYTCTFLLLKLSGDREFSVALNRQIGSVPELAHIQLNSLLHLPTILNGTHADLLLCVSHKLIISSPTHLSELLKVLLTLISNISPYLTRLSLYTSVKVLHLMQIFCNPTFLYANAHNYQYAVMLLEILNNILQYQNASHANLCYCILRHAKTFQLLGRLEETDGAKDPSRRTTQQPGDLLSFDLQHRSRVPNPISTTIAEAEQNHSPTAAVAVRMAQARAIVPTTMAAQPTTESTAPIASSAASSSATAASSSSTSPSSASSTSPPSPSSSPGTAKVLNPTPTTPVSSFTATAEWANSWKRSLPLEPIYRLLAFFEPKIHALVINMQCVDESAILDLISKTTLAGVLPVPHPIVVRKYIQNPYTDQWFCTFLLGVIFLRQQTLAQLTYGTASGATLWIPHKVKLFTITNQQQMQEQEMNQKQGQTTRQHQPRSGSIQGSQEAQPEPQVDPRQRQQRQEQQQQQHQQQQQQLTQPPQLPTPSEPSTMAESVEAAPSSSSSISASTSASASASSSSSPAAASIDSVPVAALDPTAVAVSESESNPPLTESDNLQDADGHGQATTATATVTEKEDEHDDEDEERQTQGGEQEQQQHQQRSPEQEQQRPSGQEQTPVQDAEATSEQVQEKKQEQEQEQEQEPALLHDDDDDRRQPQEQQQEQEQDREQEHEENQIQAAHQSQQHERESPVGDQRQPANTGPGAELSEEASQHQSSAETREQTTES